MSPPTTRNQEVAAQKGRDAAMFALRSSFSRKQRQRHRLSPLFHTAILIYHKIETTTQIKPVISLLARFVDRATDAFADQFQCAFQRNQGFLDTETREFSLKH